MGMLAGLVGYGSGAKGIVRHPGSTEPWDRPDERVLVRWSSNASAVAIGPSWLITTRHQITSPATVQIDGVTYRCLYQPDWQGGPTGKVDMRLVGSRVANSMSRAITRLWVRLFRSVDLPALV